MQEVSNEMEDVFDTVAGAGLYRHRRSGKHKLV